MLIIESDIESYLKKRVEYFGGRCIKFTPIAEAGIPDRIVILPEGKIAFVELKRPTGGKLSKLQEYQIDRLKALGCIVRVVKNYEEVNDLLEELVNGNRKH